MEDDRHIARSAFSWAGCRRSGRSRSARARPSWRRCADRGYDAWPLFVDRDIDLVLRQTRIDVAFLALHGRYGEDGCIQGLLELLGIPYTGSGVLASALAMNKVKAKEVFRLHNLPTAPGYVVAGGQRRGHRSRAHGSFGFPVVVKPGGEGSSLGIASRATSWSWRRPSRRRCASTTTSSSSASSKARRSRSAMLDGKPLGAVEIVPKRGFYDFHNKYTAGRTDYHLPARLSPERYRSALRLATLAHDALGCDGATRVDLIVSERGNEVVLEVNTLPGHDADQPAAPDRARRGPVVRGSRRGDAERSAPARPRSPARSARGPGRLQGPERRAGFMPKLTDQCDRFPSARSAAGVRDGQTVRRYTKGSQLRRLLPGELLRIVRVRVLAYGETAVDLSS